jgi:hypothetical protein
MQHKFVPTPEQKRFVALMAGAKMGWEQIRSVVRNPRTNKPISRVVLGRAFKDELATAKTRLQSTVLSKYYEALMRGDAWAIQWGLKHFWGFRDGDVTLSLGGGDGESAADTGICVTFVKPTRWANDDKVIEAKPMQDHPGFNGGNNGSKG